MIRSLVESPGFARASRKFTKRNEYRRECIRKTILQMAADIFHSSLETHPLKGRLAGFHACSCGYDCRIIFEIVKNPNSKTESIVLVNVGTHDEVY